MSQKRKIILPHSKNYVQTDKQNGLVLYHSHKRIGNELEMFSRNGVTQPKDLVPT